MGPESSSAASASRSVDCATSPRHSNSSRIFGVPIGVDLPLPSMPMLLQIRGHHLPGGAWRSPDAQYDNVHVGIQVGKEPRELVRGDADTSTWTIPIEVVDREGGLDFRGAAGHGRPGCPVLVLTPGGVLQDRALS